LKREGEKVWMKEGSRVQKNNFIKMAVSFT
jgi:hypothetical protein